jgi:hypothetical protein
VDVEPLQDGHAVQQSEQNALPKQQAIEEPRDPRQRPISYKKKTIEGSKIGRIGILNSNLVVKIDE